MLKREDTMFVLVDVQGKPAEIVQESGQLEQYPEGLGPTSPALTVHLEDLESIPKMTFNGCSYKVVFIGYF